MLSKIQYHTASLLIALYGVELLDELIYGLGGAALPLIKNDLALSYTQVGLLFTVPGVIALAVDPLIGLWGDTRHRRLLVLSGILATALGLLLVSLGQTFALLLCAFTILYLASGAYVNLSQATLVDRDLARAEQTMVRWTLLGSIGVALAPVLLTIALALGGSWRQLYLACGLFAGLYTGLLARQEFDLHTGAADESVSLRQLGRNLLTAFGKRELWRWMLLTECADLMLDKLLEVTGLYFHDVAGVSFAAASLAVAISASAGLVGNLLLVPVLEKIPGTRFLRFTAFAALGFYLAFLLVPSVSLKFVLIGVLSLSTSGWFAILHGKAYATLPGQSGLIVAATSLANTVGLLVPIIIGQVSDTLGLSWAMWLFVLGPLALIIGLPRE